MKNYAVFLRAINVGGNNLIEMSSLKELLSTGDFKNVATILNSGNIALTAPYDHESLFKKLETLITERYKSAPDIFIKNYTQIKEIILKDPFNPVLEADFSKRMVIFLSAVPADNAIHLLKEKNKTEAYFWLYNDIMYTYYPKGAGKSQFTLSFIEKQLKVRATARNWNTILKMSALLKRYQFSEI